MLPKEIIIVYRTDAWHTYASREIIGICENVDDAIKIIKSCAWQERKKLSPDDLFNLRSISQTQGYKGEGEFQFEYFKTNTLL